MSSGDRILAIAIGVMLLGITGVILGAEVAMISHVINHHHTVGGVIAAIGGFTLLDGFWMYVIACILVV